MASPETWIEIVDRLRAERGMSQDDLAFAARSRGAPSTLTGSWISQLKKGTRPLAPDILRGIAGALGIEPETFAEYRLMMARASLDEDAVGLEPALARLADLEAVDQAAADLEAKQRELREAASASPAPKPAPGRAPGRSAAKARKRGAA